MANDPKYFEEPIEIKNYGILLNRYADAMKAVAAAQSALRVDVDAIKTVVGRGPYNTVEATQKEEYIVYGEDAMREAAKQTKAGLFGAFYYLHRPELEMSLQAPKLWGEAGCRLKAEVDGVAMYLPLQDIKIDFHEQSPDGAVRGKIFLEEETQWQGDDGKTHILPAGAVLTNGRSWVMNGKKTLFSIVDKEDKQINNIDAVKMLWGHVGAKEGLKRQGKDTPRFNTLATDGVEDDFNAEGAMVSWLLELKEHHHINLMPEFNMMITHARDSLVNKPQMLEAMSAAIAMSQKVRAVMDNLPNNFYFYQFAGDDTHNDYIGLAAISTAAAKINDTADALGLSLPDVSHNPTYAPLLQAVQNVADAFTTHINDYTEQTLLADIKKTPLHFIDQCSQPFDKAWLRGEGNQIISFAKITQDSHFYHGIPLRFLENVNIQEIVQEHGAPSLCRTAKQKILTAFENASIPMESIGLHLQKSDMTAATTVDAPTRDELVTTINEGVVALRQLEDSVRKDRVTKALLAFHVARCADACEAMDYVAQHMCSDNVSATMDAWNAQRATMHDFIGMMQAVECDPERWMKLYTKVAKAKEMQDTLVSSQPDTRVTEILARCPAATLNEERGR